MLKDELMANILTQDLEVVSLSPEGSPYRAKKLVMNGIFIRDFKGLILSPSSANMLS